MTKHRCKKSVAVFYMDITNFINPKKGKCRIKKADVSIVKEEFISISS